MPTNKLVLNFALKTQCAKFSWNQSYSLVAIVVPRHTHPHLHTKEHFFSLGKTNKIFDRCTHHYQVSVNESSTLLLVSHLAGSICLMGGHRTTKHFAQFLMLRGRATHPQRMLSTSLCRLVTVRDAQKNNMVYGLSVLPNKFQTQ